MDEGKAAKRGLLNLTNTVDALPELVGQEAVKTFERNKVLNDCEMHARHEIARSSSTSRPSTSKAQLMVLMANRYILSAALAYQKNVAESVKAVKDAGGPLLRRKRRKCSITFTISSIPSGSGMDKLAKAARPLTARVPRSTPRHEGAVVAAMVELRGRRPARAGSCRTSSGRCRPIARCCSSSRPRAASGPRGRRARSRSPGVASRFALGNGHPLRSWEGVFQRLQSWRLPIPRA